MTDEQAIQQIGDYILSHESETYSELAARLGLTRAMVSRIARLRGIKRRPGKRSAALQAAVAIIEAATAQPVSVSAGDVVTPPAEKPIPDTLDAPPVDEALLATAVTPLAEIAVA